MLVTFREERDLRLEICLREGIQEIKKDVLVYIFSFEMIGCIIDTS